MLRSEMIAARVAGVAVLAVVAAACSSSRPADRTLFSPHAAQASSTVSAPTSSSALSVYRANAKILVTVDGVASAEQAKAIAVLATTNGVLLEIEIQLHLSIYRRKELAHMITAKAEVNAAGYVDIFVEDTVPTRAAEIANAAARSVVLVAHFTAIRDQLFVVQPAVVPTTPVR